MSGKELRVELIRSKLAKLGDSLEIIQTNIPSNFDSLLKMGLAKDGLYKKVEYSVELILDICNIINTDLKLGMPENEDDILKNIEKNKIFSSMVIAKISEVKGFRNILVHKYGEVDDNQAYESIKEGMGDFFLIVREIEKFLKKR